MRTYTAFLLESLINIFGFEQIKIELNVKCYQPSDVTVVGGVGAGVVGKCDEI